MHQDASSETVTRDWNDSDGDEQFPVDTDVIRKIRFDTNGSLGDLLRIVVMNKQSTSENRANQEYHHGNSAVSIQSVSTFTMRSGTLETSQQAIDSFVGSLPLNITLGQAPIWVRGVYTASGVQKRLYKATDPDDSTKMIGVLLEQDTAGHLTQITWYKTSDAGPLFWATPSTVEFSLVTDENGAASLDPSHIGGWTWYYTTSFGHT